MFHPTTTFAWIHLADSLYIFWYYLCYQQDFQFAELLVFNISFVYTLTRQNNNRQDGKLHQSPKWRLLAFQFETCQPGGNISSPGQTGDSTSPATWSMLDWGLRAEGSCLTALLRVWTCLHLYCLVFSSSDINITFIVSTQSSPPSPLQNISMLEYHQKNIDISYFVLEMLTL